MATLRDDVQAILRELIRLQATPGPVHDPDDPFPLPRMISAGPEGSLFVSQAMDRMIAAVADRLFANDPALALKHTRAEWRAMTRAAFGPVLARVDLDADLANNAEQVLSAVRAVLQAHAARHPDREFAFGCTLFKDPARTVPDVGVVRFESRDAWLSRKIAEGQLSVITGRRLSRAWEARPVRRRKRPRDGSAEHDVREAISNCRNVCSVATVGLAPQAAQEKALLAARLATLAIALVWERPSNALSGLNLLFDRGPFLRRTLVFAAGQILSTSSRAHLPYAPWVEADTWKAKLPAYEAIFRSIREVLEYVVSPDGTVRRPAMMRTLTQAMMWFHDACREPSALVAVVKFAAALDALSCGGQKDGIRRLLTARVGLTPQAPLWSDGPTLKQAVERIYGPGRSQTIHGTNDQHGHDWSDTRAVAEQLGRLALVTCLDWVATNPSCDDPRQLAR